MSAPKTIVKEAVNRDSPRRRETPPPSPAGAGRKVGETTRIEVTPDRIRVRAYEIYLARNGAPGDAESDWVQAEHELNGRAAPGSACERAGADPGVLKSKATSKALRQGVKPAINGP